MAYAHVLWLLEVTADVDGAHPVFARIAQRLPARTALALLDVDVEGVNALAPNANRMTAGAAAAVTARRTLATVAAVSAMKCCARNGADAMPNDVIAV